MGPDKSFAFGKGPFQPGLVNEYRVLYAGNHLSSFGRAAFESLGKEFAWQVGAHPDKYSSVAAVMELSGVPSILVCRILDDGQDNIKRPHLLRIEGVELADTDLGLIQSFLDPHGWSLGNETWQPVLNPPGHADQNPSTWQVPSHKDQWFFPGADRKDFRHTPIPRDIYKEAVITVSKENKVLPPKLSSVAVPWVLGVVSLVVAVCSVVSSVHYFRKNSSLEGVIGQQIKEITNLKSKLEKEVNEEKIISEDNKRKSEEIKNLLEKLSNSEKENAGLKKSIHSSPEDIRRDNNQLRDKNTRYESAATEYFKKIDKIKSETNNSDVKSDPEPSFGKPKKTGSNPKTNKVPAKGNDQP